MVWVTFPRILKNIVAQQADFNIMKTWSIRKVRRRFRKGIEDYGTVFSCIKHNHSRLCSYGMACSEIVFNAKTSEILIKKVAYVGSRSGFNEKSLIDQHFKNEIQNDSMVSFERNDAAEKCCCVSTT